MFLSFFIISIKVYTMLGLIKETSTFDQSLYFQNLEIIQQQIDFPAQQRKLKLDQLQNLEYNDLVDLFNAGFKDLDDKGEDSLLNAINAQTTDIKSKLMRIYKFLND